MEEIYGHSLYRKFDITVKLDIIRRQNNTDPDSARFKETLEHLREDKLQLADWELLCTRVKAVIPHEAKSFKDALQIYNKKSQVYKFNHNRLSTHQSLNTKKTSSDEASNLHA
ncbi:hypothetical protein TSTA_085530 [Talaromyces stipitatus ATCC 10500]|uniref:Uncharacterized protein n=1 Tax=Talaromyces stipitatus (strain ATCC 10500 / CBS 375.48 / QM 6759 / NRRL 1006) TaxID=441959 RepID=B8M1U4_TALSN|nr:uncharacterized protein TSTA_085530 [Talaromyces stipitatus ATCC 10500]EED21322.1 hypothetical protein TSTA_085530 [Talaromyces stipitatus ATCC 10500]